MTESWESRRAAPRYKVVTLAWYKRIDDRAADAEEGVARSFDVSDQGAGLVATQAVPVGTRLLLQLVVPYGRVTALARVMNSQRLTNGAYQLGLEIYCVPPPDLATWKRLVGE